MGKRLTRPDEAAVGPSGTIGPLDEDLSSAYAEMAADEAREAGAREWSDHLISDAGDE